MHLYTRIVLIMAISSVVKCFTILDSQSHYGNETHRNGRRINGLVASRQVASRQVEPCISVAEDYDGGDVSIYGRGGVFKNPKEPAELRNVSNNKKRQRQSQRQGRQSSEVYKAELCPTEEVFQIKLQINMTMKDPTNGMCSDKLTFIGANEGLQIPELCGIVGFDTPQILFIDIDPNKGPFSIEVTTVDDGEAFAPKIWNISIAFLNRNEAGPPRCLQYHTEPTGTIQSFNYGGQGEDEDSRTSLVNMRYSICFEYIVGYCGIKFDFDRFDVGSLYNNCIDDYLLIGDDKHCGDTGIEEVEGLQDRKTVRVDWSGPIYVNVRMDDNNEDNEEGFKATYMMIPCVDMDSTETGTYLRTPTTASTPPTTNSQTSYDTSDLPTTTESDSLNFFWL